MVYGNITTQVREDLQRVKREQQFEQVSNRFGEAVRGASEFFKTLTEKVKGTALGLVNALGSKVFGLGWDKNLDLSSALGRSSVKKEEKAAVEPETKQVTLIHEKGTFTIKTGSDRVLTMAQNTPDLSESQQYEILPARRVNGLGV